MAARWSVYIVRCRDGALYTGIALDVRRRLAQHAGTRNGGAKYLRGKSPLRLEMARPVGTRALAQSVEHRIKRLTRRRKLALIAKKSLLNRLITSARSAKNAVRTAAPAVLLAASVLFGLAACSITLGRKFPAENIPSIVVGVTSEADLQGTFGDPTFRRTLSVDDFESNIWGWGYGTSTASGNKGHELHVETLEGVVNGFLFSSSLEPDATDFDLSLADQLHAGRSTLADAERLLGPPDGRLRIPTNLLHDWFGPMKAALAPQGATQAIVYAFMDLAVQQDAAIRRVKLLIVFAGPDGTITAVRRFDGTR